MSKIKVEKIIIEGKPGVRIVFPEKEIIENKIKCKQTGIPESGKYGSFYHHSCIRNAWKDGFCKQHHPEEVKKRAKAQELRWEEKQKNSPLGRLQVVVAENKELKKLLFRLFEVFTGEGNSLEQVEIDRIDHICKEAFK